jgi:Domain of unknown function (DUF4440)
MRTITCIVILLSIHISSAAQNTEAELFNLLRAKDSLLFSVGFNKCDLSQFEKIVSTNFEFYHDKGGITPSKEKFLESIRTGLCKDPANYQSRRELVPGSLQVFPLSTNGKLYGAIQTGVHKFYEKAKDQPERAGSVAKFTHLWLLEFNEWKLARVLSYDHKN